MQEWCDQDGDRGHTWLYSFAQEEQLTTTYGKDTTEKILEHEDDAEASPWTTETKTNC